MDPIYVTGHRNPDTDSIVAAMAYAALRNALGDREYEAACLGDPSDETKSVLEKYGFQAPKRIYNVFNQIRDLDFLTPPVLSTAVTVGRAWDIMQEQKFNTLPVANEDGSLYGMLSQEDVARYNMGQIHTAVLEPVPLFNVLSVLEGNTMPAAFFLKQEELLPGAETLRELVSRGFSVGILLSSAEDPVAEAQACSQLYAQLLHQRVRLVCSAGLELTEEQKTALAEAGFVLWSPSLDPDTGDLSSGKLLSAAQKALRNAPEQSSLRLYPTDLTAEILPVICSYLLAQNFTASPINEWTAPF